MTTSPAEPSLLLTVDDTAKLLSVSRNTVFKLLRASDLTSMTIGAKRLIPRQEIDRFIRGRTGKRPTPKAPLDRDPSPPANTLDKSDCRRGAVAERGQQTAAREVKIAPRQDVSPPDRDFPCCT